jgi:hypothetical protein
MNLKVFIVVLAVVLILFVVVVGLTAAQGRDQPTELTPGWIKTMGNTIFNRKPLSSEDVVRARPSACRKQLEEGEFVLFPGQSCEFEVRETSSFLPSVRSLSVQLTHGIRVDGKIEGAGDVVVNVRLNGDRTEWDFDIHKGDGRLILVCVNSGSAVDPCRLKVR